LELATRDLEQGLGPSTFLARLGPISSGLPAAEQAQIEALQALADWHLDPPAALTALRHALDTLTGVDHAAALRIATFLAELAAVTENPGVILDLRARLLALAEQAEATLEHPDGEALGVRLRLCVAEADGDFAALWRRADTGRDLEPAQAELVMARYGRWLARKADPEPAEDAYWPAVDHATTAKLWGEAAEALRSLATDEALTVFERRLDRPLGQANVVDNDLRRGLFGLYRAHPDRRERTGQALLRCIELGGPLGYKTALLPFFENGLVEPLLPGLREEADRGVPNAVLALAMAEDRHPAVLAEAEQRVDRGSSPRSPGPGRALASRPPCSAALGQIQHALGSCSLPGPSSGSPGTCCAWPRRGPATSTPPGPTRSTASLSSPSTCQTQPETS
jgi:hypothetical protein